MKHVDRVLSRARLLDSVWGDRVYIEERTVDVHVRRLRKALAGTGHDRLIETVRGGGYRFLPR
jgi:two-component system phosphate regulon response regulator PhoB